MMEHKIINTENYLLIVDDSEIKDGEWVYVIDKNFLARYFYNLNSNYKKVIAHLPLNNSPILEGVILLPPLEDEVEKLCKQEAEKFHNKGKHDDWDIYNQLVYEDTEMIKIGYSKAKEKYKYTEEDLIDVFNFLSFSKKSYLEFKDFIQSLQQPKTPVGFECEMDRILVNGYKNQPPNIIGFVADYELRQKTITNSQGITQWVGEYIY